jgi:integrase
MTKRNAENERIKRRYLVYLKDAKGRDTASIDAAASAIERFEDYGKRRDFRSFHIEQARGFKAQLMAATNVRTGKPLSASTIHTTLAALKAFIVWLADQPSYASRIKYADAEYFTPPDNLSRIATARRFKNGPTLSQVRLMISALPDATELERRDRALIAFAILSGARDRAIISFRLKHLDIECDLIEQDSREIRTKRAKTFTTWFFPVGEDIRQIVVDWVQFLREKKGFGPEDPLFPKTRVTTGEDFEFRARALDDAPWANANPVRNVFREACARAGLPYFNPHLMRNTLVQLAYELKLDAKAIKAWSQNLGHASTLTTLASYGNIPPARQGEIIRRLCKRPSASAMDHAAMLRQLADQMEAGLPNSDREVVRS